MIVIINITIICIRDMTVIINISIIFICDRDDPQKPACPDGYV